MDDAVDYGRYEGPERVFSGVQSSGVLTLGNYLGALVKFVRLQHEKECLFCVVDMHAITVWQEPVALRAATRAVAAAFIAAGVDPNKATIFAQSAVPEHAELAWILNCVARFGWLNRMTQFKDKAGKNREAASVGLFVYPNLMAADILGYKATHVPVGEDQKQHLELARDIALKFNTDYERPGWFPMPEPLIEGPGARVMSLRDGTKKMSKSDPSEMSRIDLSDDNDAIALKIRKAKTDSEPLPETPEGLEGRPEAKNLVGLYAALSGGADDHVLREWGGRGFGDFKPALAEVMVARMAPIRDEMTRLIADAAELDALLAKGAEKARALSAPIVAETKRIVGLQA